MVLPLGPAPALTALVSPLKALSPRSPKAAEPREARAGLPDRACALPWPTHQRRYSFPPRCVQRGVSPTCFLLCQLESLQKWRQPLPVAPLQAQSTHWQRHRHRICVGTRGKMWIGSELWNLPPGIEFLTWRRIAVGWPVLVNAAGQWFPISPVFWVGAHPFWMSFKMHLEIKIPTRWRWSLAAHAQPYCSEVSPVDCFRF